jgi:putative hydrolase of the HAD superfamily
MRPRAGAVRRLAGVLSTAVARSASPRGCACLPPLRREGTVVAEPRAVVFDLDDTLYPLRSFVLSGFAAVANEAARTAGVPPARLASALRHAGRRARGRELQQLCDRFDLPASDVARFVETVRRHTPRIRLPRETTRILAALRPRWRLGVLTNGVPAIQRRKVAALGLADLVDAIVFATECGDGTGKPDRAPFDTVLDRLGTSPARSVFVGDDLEADIAGARGAGMRTIHVAPRARRSGRRAGIRPDAQVTTLRSVPRIAERLVTGGSGVSRI